MSPPSIRRQLMGWVLGALCLGAPLLVFAAYLLCLDEFDEVLNDSLRQTALLLADRDLDGGVSAPPTAATLAAIAASTTESKLVAIARKPDGALLYTSDPQMALRFEPIGGASVQRANETEWDVFTVVQGDRYVQVAQPTSVRREGAAEAATQLMLPLGVLIAVMGLLLVVALRRGLRPLAVASVALARRNAESLDPLDVAGVPTEVLPVVHTLNHLLQRLATAFEAQRHFVADAAHELRSPVTALQLQVQILQQSRDPRERAQATDELSAGIGRARRLIEQLLQLSRSSANDTRPTVLESVSLTAAARAAVVRWVVEAERRGIDLGAEGRTDVHVLADPGQLEVLLNNLVENALRYTPGGGTVDVVAYCLDRMPTLSVIDDGPGIAAAERERVLDRFYRSPNLDADAEIGSGLGLAIVKAIAERHCAQLTLCDGPDGKGLEVRVSFTANRPGVAAEPGSSFDATGCR